MTLRSSPAVLRGFVKILHCGISRRGALLAALLLGLVSCTLVAAQEERPQITPGERKAPRKKDAGPRAVSVLQLAANGKASLVPVAILVGGKFWDATAYKADPIPMALESGTVYEAERAGSSLGLFTVNGALHSNAENAQSPWLGTGDWRPAGSEPKNAALKAENAPAGIESNSDGPPRLTRNPAKETPPSSAPPSTTSQPSPSSSGDEPPRLTKGTPPPSSAPSTGSTPTGQSQPKTQGDSKPGEASASPGKVPETTTEKSPLQLVPAISDASGPDPKSFAFQWLKDEEEERRQQMTKLAADQVRAYVEARTKARTMPKPAGSPPARHTPAAKMKDPILENVQMTAYDLWNNNQPVLVLSADAHMPPPPAGVPHSEVDSDLHYSVLLVAYPDTYNNLHKIYAGVTDKYHLDMTPRLELVDAVDADGDRRGELLFREVADGASGWVIYRANQDNLWKLFDSLHPE